MPPAAQSHPLPEVRLSPDDHALLSSLIGDMTPDGVAGLLEQELTRAVVDADERRVPTVGLGRWVHYIDGGGAQPRRVMIVMPGEADIDRGLISPLSHVGAGLLGLAEGESIEWPDPSGRLRKLTAILIEDPEGLI